uniref:Uncharacterized protein n=1 Tax=Panagrolaimus sp. ES5 TaxID=591445 RepID=A0AC34FBS4_9BILA
MESKKDDGVGYATDGVKIDGKNDGTVIDKVVNWFKKDDGKDMTDVDPKNDGNGISKAPVHIYGNNTGTVNNHDLKYKI